MPSPYPSDLYDCRRETVDPDHPLSTFQEGLVLSTCPGGARVVEATPVREKWLPCPIRVQLALPTGETRPLILRLDCHRGGVAREAVVLPVLARLGLAVPALLAGPVCDPDRPSSGAMTVLSVLPGEDLGSLTWRGAMPVERSIARTCWGCWSRRSRRCRVNTRGDGAAVTRVDDLALVQWAPRVAPGSIRRLYETDALGIVDEEQIALVAEALAARCRSILEVTAAHAGHVTCPRCAKRFRLVPAEEWIHCRSCGWRVARRDYQRTYQHQQLHGAGAIACFEAFLDALEQVHSPQETMLVIDRLLHAFHQELAAHPGRPAAKNLLALPTTAAVLAFLDRLASGDASTPGLRASKERWREAAPRTVSPRLRRALQPPAGIKDSDA